MYEGNKELTMHVHQCTIMDKIIQGLMKYFIHREDKMSV